MWGLWDRLVPRCESKAYVPYEIVTMGVLNCCLLTCVT